MDDDVRPRMTVVVESERPEVIAPFWRAVLGPLAGGDREAGASGTLDDPEVRLEAASDTGRGPAATAPPRDVVHLDVARPGADPGAVEAVTGRPAGGPYGLAHVDDDGHVVDLLGDGPLGEDEQVSDWRTLFAAKVAYRGPAAAVAQVADVAAHAAGESNVSLRVDADDDLLVLDGGKDRWELPDGSLEPRFLRVAARIQAAARAAGLRPDARSLRFLQVGIDAVDLERSRAFWAAALGLRFDERPGVTDLYDPDLHLPVLLFQPLQDPAEPRARSVRLEVTLAAVSLEDRRAAALAAGGREVTAPQPESDTVTLADPDGIRLVLRPADRSEPAGSEGARKTTST